MSQQWNSGNAGEEDVQMPLGTGADPAPAEEYTGGGKRLNVNTSTIALVAAFGAALVMLYLLGLQNKPRIASAQEKQHVTDVEKKINEILSNTNERQQMGNFLNDSTKLFELLTKYFDRSGAAVDLPDNPFEHEAPRIIDTSANAKPLVTAPAVNAQEERELLLVSQEFNNLKLQMVMMGSTPAAMIIDGTKSRMMTMGTKLKYLTLTEIQADHVILTWKERKFQLELNHDKLDKQ